MKRCEWHEIPHYWPQVEPLVAAALAHGSIAYRPADIYRYLLTRQQVLWLALAGEEAQACAVTRINVFPRAKVCAVLLIGGSNMDGWLPFEADIYDWAKAMGCQALEGPGRRGWERKARPLGWAPVWTVYRRMIEED